jgi:peroxiredoxin
MKKYRIALILLSIIFFIGISTKYRFNNKIKSLPEMTLITITGNKINLKDLQGHPVIITFWATDCPTCIKEIPDLIDLYSKYHYKGLEIIAISMSYDSPSHVITFTEDMRLPYKIVLDMSSEIAKAFGNIELTPSTFVLDQQGNVIEQQTGKFDLEKIKSLIETMIKG